MVFAQFLILCVIATSSALPYEKSTDDFSLPDNDLTSLLDLRNLYVREGSSEEGGTKLFSPIKHFLHAHSILQKAANKRTNGETQSVPKYYLRVGLGKRDAGSYQSDTIKRLLMVGLGKRSVPRHTRSYNSQDSDEKRIPILDSRWFRVGLGKRSVTPGDEPIAKEDDNIRAKRAVVRTVIGHDDNSYKQSTKSPKYDILVYRPQIKPVTKSKSRLESIQNVLANYLKVANGATSSHPLSLGFTTRTPGLWFGGNKKSSDTKPRFPTRLLKVGLGKR